MGLSRTHQLYYHFPTKKWPYQVGPIFRHDQIRWDASHSRSGFNHQLYTYIPILDPWAHTHPCCMAKLFSIAPADSQPISWWPRNGYFSMSTALKKSQLNGFNITITYNVLDWKDQIHSFSGLSLFQLRLFLSAKNRSAAQRLKKRRVLRSQRGLPFSLSPMRTTSGGHSAVRERVCKEGNQIGKIGLHHVTSILVCSHTAPYCIPGILCWEILWVCNSPWARACFQASE